MISRDEIMKLDAGREIDVLVAEQVMNWQLESDGPKLKKLNGYFPRDDNRRWWRNPDGGWHCDPPGYSSDIKYGWEVVEKMKASGKFLSLFQNSNGNRVAFESPDASEADYIIEKHVLLGICKAALIACI
jgi:hypothetical protein